MTMLRSLWQISVAVLFLAGCSQPRTIQGPPTFEQLATDAQKGVKRLSVEHVREKLSRREPFVIVDVREVDEWNAGHLRDARHVPRGVLERTIEQDIPDRSAVIVLYCTSGYRSALAAESLQKMGYTSVYSMDGGYRAWAAKSQ